MKNKSKLDLKSGKRVLFQEFTLLIGKLPKIGCTCENLLSRDWTWNTNFVDWGSFHDILKSFFSLFWENPATRFSPSRCWCTTWGWPAGRTWARCSWRRASRRRGTRSGFRPRCWAWGQKSRWSKALDGLGALNRLMIKTNIKFVVDPPTFSYQFPIGLHQP